MQNNFLRNRSNSINVLGYTTLKQISKCKRQKIISNSTAKLYELKTFYDSPLIQRKPQPKSVENQQEQFTITKSLNEIFEPDFLKKAMKLCEDIVFYLTIFLKVYKQNHRTKLIMAKFYGWDQAFQDILFPHKRLELKIDFTAEQIYTKLGLNIKSVKSRNIYNKLRLFLSELASFNKKQQQLQGKFIKNRISSQFAKIDQQMKRIAINNNKYIMKFVEQITRTQTTMLNNKIKIHNKMNAIKEIQGNCGKVNINQFYLKEENNVYDIQKYFTDNRMSKQM